LRIHDCDETILDRLLDEFRPLSPAPRRTLANTLQYAVKRLKPKKVLVESDYICKDYRSEYSALYSKRFKKFSDRSTRLHFFASSDVSVDLLKDPSRDSTEFGYLGYIVMRPTDVGRVGRTLLPHPAWDSNKFYIPCTAYFPAHILGCEFSIEGMPFCQQDGMVMTCAQAAVWMACHLLSRRVGLSAPLPHEINESCSRYYLGWVGRALPSGGLTVENMVNGLSDLKYSPIFHRIDGPDQRKNVAVEMVCKYIESGIPVILMLPGHAVTACGYVYDPDRNIQQKGPVVGFENWVKALIVHDDAVGPYRIMPVDETARADLVNSDVADLLMPEGWPERRIRNTTTKQIEGVIVPLPDKVYLTGDWVCRIARSLIDDRVIQQPVSIASKRGEQSPAKFLHALHADSDDRVVLRAYFLSAESFKASMRVAPLRGTMSPTVREHYQTVSMSRLIWVVELTLSDELQKQDEADRHVYGEVLLDSTASPYGPSFLSIHLPGVLFIQNLNSEGQITAIPLPDDKPYLYPRDFALNNPGGRSIKGVNRTTTVA
jgi:hypothetical protein